MYIATATSSASALLRASRTRFFSSSSTLSRTFLGSSTPAKPSPHQFSAQRFLSSSAAATRWSHGVHWRAPFSLRSQIRAAAPLLERVHRRFATMAPENHPFKETLTSLPKPGGGEYGKFYSLPSLNDPRIDDPIVKKSTAASRISLIDKGVKDNAVTIKEPEELFVPGTVYYLKRNVDAHTSDYFTLWKRDPGEHFQRIVLSSNLISDHKCDSHYYALRDVLKGLPSVNGEASSSI